MSGSVYFNNFQQFPSKSYTDLYPSDTLIIRNIPKGLSISDMKNLLERMNCERIWTKKIGATFLVRVKFSNHHDSSMVRQVLQEWEHEPGQFLDIRYDTQTSHEVSRDLTEIDSWKEIRMRLYDSKELPAYLRFIYPTVTDDIIKNISEQLRISVEFYNRVIHLMNVMNLEPPFEESTVYRRKIKMNPTGNQIFNNPVIGKDDLIEVSTQTGESDESELESDSDEKLCICGRPKIRTNQPIKRSAPVTHPIDVGCSKRLKLTRVVTESIRNNEIQGKKKRKKRTSRNLLRKMFRGTSTAMSGNKPIQIITKTTVDDIESHPVESEDQTELFTDTNPIQDVEILNSTKQPSKELKYTRLSDLDQHPLFKNYDCGTPSLRLYIKNIAKSVSDQEIRDLYEQFHRPIDVRLMQKGRMKGQAFITFLPSNSAELSKSGNAEVEPVLELSIKEALNATNGLMIHDQPIVVVYGRVS